MIGRTNDGRTNDGRTNDGRTNDGRTKDSVPPNQGRGQAPLLPGPVKEA